MTEEIKKAQVENDEVEQIMVESDPIRVLI
jgi:hypothetical protein